MILTVKRKPSPLRGQVVGIHEAFTSLRESAAWRDQVIGGARFFEVTHTDEGWGPHIHTVLEAKAIDLKPISDRWLALTGDGKRTFCRLVEDSHDGRMNLCYYVTQPPFESFVGDAGLMGQYRRAVRNLNLVRTFGGWHRLSLLPRRRASSTSKSD